jgi:glycerol uptake facilitator-like aquaporin
MSIYEAADPDWSSMRARFLAELIGTASIVMAVLGAGFMVSNLSADPALGLFMIASTVAGVLFVVISSFASTSGAHFNPIVTIAFLAHKDISAKHTAVYFVAQFMGGLLGALIANLMFIQTPTLSEVGRFSLGSMVGESVASAGLVLLILQLVYSNKEKLIAPAVALWIFAGHIFTSSTAFANPAVTIGRVFSTAPSSIAVESALYFILAQFIGLGLALFVSAQLRKAIK